LLVFVCTWKYPRTIVYQQTRLSPTTTSNASAATTISAANNRHCLNQTNSQDYHGDIAHNNITGCGGQTTGWEWVPPQLIIGMFSFHPLVILLTSLQAIAMQQAHQDSTLHGTAHKPLLMGGHATAHDATASHRQTTQH
jgi:streptomycin 6-kinase